MNTKPIVENRVWQPEFECLPRKELEALQVKRLRCTTCAEGALLSTKIRRSEDDPGIDSKSG